MISRLRPSRQTPTGHRGSDHRAQEQAGDDRAL